MSELWVSSHAVWPSTRHRETGKPTPSAASWAGRCGPGHQGEGVPVSRLRLASLRPGWWRSTVPDLDTGGTAPRLPGDPGGNLERASNVGAAV